MYKIQHFFKFFFARYPELYCTVLRIMSLLQNASKKSCAWKKKKEKISFYLFFASGVGFPLTHPKIVLHYNYMHSYPAAHQDHCGRWRNLTQDLCPRGLVCYPRATTSPVNEPLHLGFSAMVHGKQIFVISSFFLKIVKKYGESLRLRGLTTKEISSHSHSTENITPHDKASIRLYFIQYTW